jgi:hypothetical protein
VVARVNVVDAATAPPPPPPPSSPSPSGGNLWVDGNGGSCQRAASPSVYSDAAACGGLAAAHAAAQPGDIVRIKGGGYGDQTFTLDKGSPAITFRPADGESPTFNMVRFNTGSGWVTLQGLRMDRYVVGETGTGPGQTPPPAAHDLAFVDIDAAIFSINRADRVNISGGDYGPAFERKPNIAVSNPWDSYAPTDVTVQGARFHDITMSPGGEHVECILIYAAERVSLRNNTFSNCGGTGDLGLMFLRVDGYRPHLANVVVENNTFSSEPWAKDGDASYNAQIDRCIPGLTVQNNVTPKGIYWINC